MRLNAIRHIASAGACRMSECEIRQRRETGIGVGDLRYPGVGLPKLEEETNGWESRNNRRGPGAARLWCTCAGARLGTRSDQERVRSGGVLAAEGGKAAPDDDIDTSALGWVVGCAENCKGVYDERGERQRAKEWTGYA